VNEIIKIGIGFCLGINLGVIVTCVSILIYLKKYNLIGTRVKEERK